MKATFNSNSKSSNGWLPPELDAATAASSYRSSDSKDEIDELNPKSKDGEKKKDSDGEKKEDSNGDKEEKSDSKKSESEIKEPEIAVEDEKAAGAKINKQAQK